MNRLETILNTLLVNKCLRIMYAILDIDLQYIRLLRHEYRFEFYKDNRIQQATAITIYHKLLRIKVRSEFSLIMYNQSTNLSISLSECLS